jgi:hypothetical protein
MRIRKWYTAAAIAAILVTTGMAPANASVAPPGATTTPNTSVTTAELVIDCSTVTPAGIRYAKKHHINFCGVLSKSTSTVTPFDSVDNNCGEAHIYMSQGTGSGEAHIEWGISADWEIISYGLDVHYGGSAAHGVIPDSGLLTLRAPLTPFSTHATSWTPPLARLSYENAACRLST